MRRHFHQETPYAESLRLSDLPNEHLAQKALKIEGDVVLIQAIETQPDRHEITVVGKTLLDASKNFQWINQEDANICLYDVVFTGLRLVSHPETSG